MVTRAPYLAALCALLVAVVACAGSNPAISTNTKDQGRTWAYCDSIVHHKTDGGNTITLVLLEGTNGTRGQLDSILTAWRNGGPRPKFRRIQGIRIFPEATNGLAAVTLDFFHSDGTSANNKFVLQYETYLEIPVEADSIHLTSSFNGIQDLDFCIW